MNLSDVLREALDAGETIRLIDLTPTPNYRDLITCWSVRCGRTGSIAWLHDQIPSHERERGGVAEIHRHSVSRQSSNGQTGQCKLSLRNRRVAERTHPKRTHPCAEEKWTRENRSTTLSDHRFFKSEPCLSVNFATIHWMHMSLLPLRPLKRQSGTCSAQPWDCLLGRSANRL